MENLLPLLSPPIEPEPLLPVGPPPQGPMIPLKNLPGSLDSGPTEVALGSDAFSRYLLTQALDLLTCPSHKVRASVLHDLMEAQGLLKGKNSAPPPPPAPNLNQFFGSNDALTALAEALSGLAKGGRNA